MSHDLFRKQEVLELFAEDLTDENLQKKVMTEPFDRKICVIFKGDEKEFSGFLISLKNRFQSLYFAIVATRQADLKSFLSLAPHWVLPELHVLAKPFDKKDKTTLSCKETKNFIQSLRDGGALAKPLPYRDFQTKLPERHPEIVQWESVHSKTPFFSVIIPTRNCEDFLINVISHLTLQDLPYDQFEIIVVDDGGTDSSLKKLQAFLGPLSSALNFTYIYCPRVKSHDEQFNAGYCRNKGLQFAKGEWMLFLDSDILLPQDFLAGLKEQTRGAEVIQCPRMHILPEKSNQATSLKALQKRDLYLEEPGYWGKFFASDNWGGIPFGWRYTCTYCLAVSRQALARVGAFREVFSSYGFEDTDLGYRLNKAGYRFLLWKKTTYHLTPPKDKSRYYHSIWRKQLLLEKTGKIFFLSTLDPEVYSLFEIYMQGESKWRQAVYGLFKI